MNIRKATQEDLPQIVQLLANDELDRLREDFREPLPKKYLNAFQKITKDQNQELVVLLNDSGLVIGTLQFA